jgi:hypothetical protein
MQETLEYIRTQMGWEQIGHYAFFLEDVMSTEHVSFCLVDSKEHVLSSCNEGW